MRVCVEFGLHAPPVTALRVAGGDPIGEDFVLQTTGYLIPSALMATH
jgi:hypothetical protein